MNNFFNTLFGGIKTDKNEVKSFDPISFVSGIGELKFFQKEESSNDKVVKPTSFVPKVPTSYNSESTKKMKTTRTDDIFNLIADLESGNNYHILAGGKIDKSITGKTVTELSNIYGNKAMGKYQIQSTSAKEVLRKNKYNPDTFIFNEEGQEKIARMLAARRGLGKIKDPIKLAYNLSQEWAALPKDKSNMSYYEGKHGNKALTTFDTVLKTLNKG